MSSTGRNQNRAVGAAIRQLVAAFLVANGHHVTAKPVPRRISDSFETALDPDIEGIPGIHMEVSARLRPRLSETLDGAVRAAKINGDAIPVAVLHRPERDVAESYAICTLADMSRLIHAVQASTSPRSS
ncbi:hypothetical protein [Microbacterium sp. AG238]|uniref:hypothetical protein n=1 Tax=Microbacterium sp. AG238 TaxID=2183994 RepID=UPI000E73BE79|nr:hypothetical protein [Microbacterium sp. AG238]RKE60514.1 hypothetical protein DEU36_2957 [Microbacterium sp. AG238]